MRNVRKNFNIFVDGRGYAGQTEDFNPPKLALTTEEFRAGGMHGPVELSMGHEALSADFSLICIDPEILSKFGVAEGFNVQVTAREALESIDGSVTPFVHSMRGKIKEIDMGTSKPGEKTTKKVTMALNYYKLTHGGIIVQEIDVINMIWRRNGIDVLEGLRAALGI